jgi:hypothetical protein
LLEKLIKENKLDRNGVMKKLKNFDQNTVILEEGEGS